MEEFLTKMVSELGSDSKTVRKASGGMLQLLQQNSSSSDFQCMMAKLPGAEEVLQAAPAASESSGGMGGLMSAASSLLGSSDSKGLGVLSSLGAAGIGLDDAPRFATGFLGFLKGKVGTDLLEKILSGVPDLKKFMV